MFFDFEFLLFFDVFLFKRDLFYGRVFALPKKDTKRKTGKPRKGSLSYFDSLSQGSPFLGFLFVFTFRWSLLGRAVHEGLLFGCPGLLCLALQSAAAVRKPKRRLRLSGASSRPLTREDPEGQPKPFFCFGGSSHKGRGYWRLEARSGVRSLLAPVRQASLGTARHKDPPEPER